MKTYSLELKGTNLIVTVTENSSENIIPFSIIAHQIELSKDANALILQKANKVLTIPIKDIATYNTYAALKTQLLLWIQNATIQVDNIELNNVTIDGSTLAKDASLVSILNKLIAAPATEGKQDALNALITSINNKDFATQNTLLAVLNKLITAPATEAKQDALNTLLSNGTAIVNGRLIKATHSFTTATGANPYSVGDVINAAGAASLRSINVGCNSGYITGLAIEMEVTASLVIPNPLPTLRVRLFDRADASLNIADNDPDEVIWANNVRRLGHIDLPIMVSDVTGGVGRIIAMDENLRFPFANLQNNLLYYKIINLTGTPTLGAAGLGRNVYVRKKIDQNI